MPDSRSGLATGWIRGGRENAAEGASRAWRRGRDAARREGTGECSLEPITVARPGVRQTLYSFSNNANKRASILRFYRVALSIFDNGPASVRAARGCLSSVLSPPARRRHRRAVRRRTADFHGINGTRTFCLVIHRPVGRARRPRDTLAAPVETGFSLGGIRRAQPRRQLATPVGGGSRNDYRRCSSDSFDLISIAALCDFDHFAA